MSLSLTSRVKPTNNKRIMHTSLRPNISSYMSILRVKLIIHCFYDFTIYNFAAFNSLTPGVAHLPKLKVLHVFQSLKLDLLMLPCQKKWWSIEFYANISWAEGGCAGWSMVCRVSIARTGSRWVMNRIQTI